MQVTARVDYAVQAMIHIATSGGRASGGQVSGGRASGGQASRGEIARERDIPAKFLEAILLRLREGGLLTARRGATGGYALARPAAEISIADVVRAVEGPLAAVRGLPPEDTEYAGAAARLRDLWVALRAGMRQVLETTTIADVAAGVLPPEVQRLLEPPEAWARR